VIPGECWVAAQERLQINKSKSYRKPRGNVALLSGLLYCANCGDYMRPKLTDRLNASGEPIYTYMCTKKERSRGSCCAIKNANGNLLDAKIIAEIKELGREGSDYAMQITQMKKAISGNRERTDEEIAKVKKQQESNEAAIKRLVDTLASAAGTAAEQYIIAQISELHEKNEMLQKRLDDLNAITSQHELADMEFDIIRQMLAGFSEGIDDYSIEQKRAAIRAFVKKVVWDGERAHVYIFGSDDDFDLAENFGGGDGESSDEPNVPLGEDSK
jgi:hypothetical protein